jgi:hypothetical protein
VQNAPSSAKHVTMITSRLRPFASLADVILDTHWLQACAKHVHPTAFPVIRVAKENVTRVVWVMCSVVHRLAKLVDLTAIDVNLLELASVIQLTTAILDMCTIQAPKLVNNVTRTARVAPLMVKDSVMPTNVMPPSPTRRQVRLANPAQVTACTVPGTLCPVRPSAGTARARLVTS